MEGEQPPDNDPEAGPVPLDVPVPPGLAEAVGYAGDARYVGFYWIPGGDEIVYDDGMTSGTGNPWAWLAFKRHRNVAPHLEEYNLGYSDLEAEHALIVDRDHDLASVALIRAAHQFLRAQHPPPPEPTPYEREELERHLQEMVERVQQGSREVKVDPEVIRQAMEKRRQDIARILAYLDAWPEV